MKKEFDIEANLLNDKEEKCDMTVGRDAQQGVGLGTLNSKQALQWHEIEVEIVLQ